MAENKIPAPSKETQLSWQRLGTGNYNLIFDTEKKEWRVIKRGDLKPNQISYNDWSSGTKTYEEKDLGAGGAGPNYQGKTNDQIAVDNAVQTATITMGPSGPVVNFTVPNPKDPKGDPVTYQSYLYVDGRGKVSLSPDDARAGIVGPEFTFDKTDAARDKHLADLYKKYGNREAIVDRLYQAGYLTTNKNVPTDAMLEALDAAAGQYTVDQVEAYKAKQIKEFSTFDDWLGLKKGSAKSLAGTRTTSQITEYSDTDARALINDVITSLMGRGASDKEYEKLVPLVQKKQRKNPQLTSTTTDVEGRTVATKTKTGINEEQFLIERLSQRDEAKATRILSYYDAFKQAIGVK
jgi:hypothetical protein